MVVFEGYVISSLQYLAQRSSLEGVTLASKKKDGSFWEKLG